MGVTGTPTLFINGQRVSPVSDVDQDVFGYYRQDDKAELAVLLAYEHAYVQAGQSVPLA